MLRRNHPVRLFGILGTWMEGDIVGATVANAMTQGCEQVFLVDNDSPDDTVDAAVAAGATLARTFASPEYDEERRIGLMNEVMHEQSAASPARQAWWLWLDGDEFPHGPHGLTIREFLAAIDHRCRVVGARYFDHYPAGEPAYVEGTHPIDQQPLCEEIPGRFCPAGHRKHPLLRVDQRGPSIRATEGFHKAHGTKRAVREASESIFIHHFPYRSEPVTRRRLDMLCTADASGHVRNQRNQDRLGGRLPGLALRHRSLDAVYRQEWHLVERKGKGGDPVTPQPWTTLVSPDDAVIARW